MNLWFFIFSTRYYTIIILLNKENILFLSSAYKSHFVLGVSSTKLLQLQIIHKIHLTKPKKK